MHVLVVLLIALLVGCGLRNSAVGPVPVEREGFFPAAEGLRLHYRAWGAGPDTVVVVHGQQGNTLDYLAPDLVSLAEERVLLAYTQRGGGRSDEVTAPERLAIASHVADLEALRRHFGLERLSLLAHSGGAGIAVRYALDHPGHVERMLLVGPMPPARAPFLPGAMQRFVARFDSTELADLTARHRSLASSEDPAAVCRDVFATMLRRVYLADTSAVHRMSGDLCSAPPDRLRTELARLQAFQQSLGDWDWRAELAALRIPILVVHGDQDAIPEAASRAWVEALPTARLLVLPGADHFPHLDRPAEFFAAAHRFFRGGWPEAAQALR